uniref:Zinc finger, C2H2 type family protein n=1 Tax=Brugia malayi TaxID=6279 RepID=A0A7I4NNG7_BRUMA
MTQIIWFSFLLWIASAENGSISLLNLDIDDNIWDDCSNGYFSNSFNILDNSNLESILGSDMDAHNSKLGNSADNLQDSISSDFSHLDFTDLEKTKHRSNEDSKIETVPITTGNYQLRELPRTDGKNMNSSNSINTEKSEIKTDLVTEKNLDLFVLQNPTITDEENYKCPHIGCTMKTKSRKKYIAHRKTHPEPFIYECKVSGCGLTFNNPSSFYSHQQTHAPRTECENCGKIFSCKNNLSTHRKYCTKIIHEENHECPHVGCSMKTKSRKEYIAHIKTHPKPFIYECKVSGCELTFNHQSSLFSHRQTHKPKPECENCGRIFSCKNNLNCHRKHCTKTPYKKNYECPHVGCTMKTKNRKEYVTHKKTHPKPFIYECKVFGCGRTFDNAASLCTHMQTHRPKLQCRDCGKFFTYMNNLYTHRKSCAEVPR